MHKDPEDRKEQRTRERAQRTQGPKDPENQRRTQKIRRTWRTLRTQRTKRTMRTWYFLLSLLFSSLSSSFRSCPLNLLAFASLSQLLKFNIQWLSFLSFWIWFQTLYFFSFLKWGSPRWDSCTSIFAFFLFVNHCTLTGLLLWSWMRG